MDSPVVRSRICLWVSVNADSIGSRPPKGKGVLSIRITGPQLRFGVFCCCKQSSKRRRFFFRTAARRLGWCAWCQKPRCRSIKRVGGSLRGGLQYHAGKLEAPFGHGKPCHQGEDASRFCGPIKTRRFSHWKDVGRNQLDGVRCGKTATWVCRKPSLGKGAAG